MDARGYMLLILAVSSKGEIYWVQSIEKISSNLTQSKTYWNSLVKLQIRKLKFQKTCSSLNVDYFYILNGTSQLIFYYYWDKKWFSDSTHDNDFFFSIYTKNTEIIEHKNDDFQLIYCCQWFQFWHTNNWLAVMFPCQQKKNLGGICLALQ